MIGYAIGPVVILYVVSTLGISATAWLMVPGVLLGILMWFLMPDEVLMPDEERLHGEPSGEDPLEHGHRKLFDAGLFFGPVGLLAVSGIMGSLSLVTFTSAVPLWLVADRGVDPDAPLIGWTFAAFSLSAGISGVVSGALGTRVDRRALVSGSMLLAEAPLLAMFLFETGSLAFFVTVALAGGLVYASLPHMILSAQDLAPHAMGAASGMLMGFASGVAGVLYIVVGRLQEVMGLAPAMVSSYLLMVPAALLALYVLTKNRTSLADS